MASPRTSAPAPRGPGRPPRSDSQRAEQRRRLLDAAMVAIRRNGPDTSIDDLAAEAGVSKPVYYAEFGDKSGIAEALALELARQGEDRLIGLLAAGGHLDVHAGVQAAVETLVTLVADEPEIYGFLVRSIRSSDLGLLDNALVRRLHDRVGMLTQLLAPGIDPHVLSVLTHGMFGFVFASVESWQRTRKPSRAVLVASLVTIILHGYNAVSTA